MKKLWRKYAKGRQTLRDLSEDFGKTPRTIRNYLDQHTVTIGEIKAPSTPVVLVIDATFFSRLDGLLVFRANQKNIYWKEIDGEKIRYYEDCLNDLTVVGFRFSAFVIDGRRGVRQLLLRMFPDVPVQLCQFHAVQTVTKYLTKKPKLEAGKQLRRIALDLKSCGRSRFTRKLKKWHQRWCNFLNERTTDESKRGWHYTHRKLRSAHRSLEVNLPWLFTYLKHPERNIPNTTNSCDGSFSHWKNKISLHRGLRRDRRKKMIDYLLENS